MRYITLAILNIGMIIAWVFLAVHFDHWWIALFALLTIFSEK